MCMRPTINKTKLRPVAENYSFTAAQLPVAKITWKTGDYLRVISLYSEHKVQISSDFTVPNSAELNTHALINDPTLIS